MSDIVERLRRVAQAEREVAMDADMRPEDTINGEYADTCDEAADTIICIHAVNDGLRDQVATMIDNADRVAFLRSQVARMEEALNRIAALGNVAAMVPGPRNKIMEICTIARAALTEAPETHTHDKRAHSSFANSENARMKLNIDPEKFLAAVDREGDHEVSVGHLDNAETAALRLAMADKINAKHGEQRTICEACGNANLAHDRATWAEDGTSYCPQCFPALTDAPSADGEV